jgi:hypothetical protein
MDIQGRGVIRHIWMTVSERDPAAMRSMIIRMYWDNSPVPSVEVPMGDFFGTAHGRTVDMASAYVSTPQGKGYNCWFPMPFDRHAKITVENDLPDGRKIKQLFFQIDYELRDRLPANTGRFHAQFRRQNPTALKQDYVVLDGVEGPGMYIGTVIGVRALSGNWWGEGEMKFYLDGDADWPTICGTGTEDYFGGAWGFIEQPKGPYCLFTTPFLGMPQVIKPDGALQSQQRFGLYRWHVLDPIRFQSDLRVTVQALGWRWDPDGKPRYLPLQDDIASTAFWYQAEPHAPFPALPGPDFIEVN